MRKIVRSIFVVFILASLNSTLQAQEAVTSKARLDNLLVQMPAKNPEQVNALMEQLVNLGDSGIRDLLQQVVTSGEGNDIAVRYALTSLARYCSQQGHENEWLRIQSDFIFAIESNQNADVRDYLIHQLNYGANDQVIEPLKKYLSNESLCEPVTQLFLCIHSKKAELAFADALSASEGATQLSLVKALGELKSKNSLPGIARLEGSGNIALQRTVLAALASIGDPQSYTILWNAAKKVHFQYEPTEATASLIKYTGELGKNKNSKLCMKSCLALIASNTKGSLLSNQAAALSIFSSYFKQESMPLLLKLSDTPDSSLRMAILRLAEKMGDVDYTNQWILKAKKSTALLKADILVMLGERNDKSAVPFVRTCLSDNSEIVRTAAIWALVKLDEKVALTNLANHLSLGNDIPEVVKALKTLVNEANLDIIANVLDKSINTGKAGIIDIIGERSGKRYFKKILAYTTDADTSVKYAAIAALKSTASFADVDVLIKLLFQTENSQQIPQIQQAIVHAGSEEKNPDIAAAPVLAALQENQQREKVVPILPFIGGNKALNAVSKLFDLSSGALRRACFDGLLAWQDYSAAAILFRICSAGNNEFRSDAFKGYVRQINNSNLPDDQKLLKFQMILPLAQNNNEKISVIHSLANVKTFLSLVYVSKFLDDSVLQESAANAASEIALPGSDEVGGLTGDIARTILNTVIQKLNGPESNYIKEKIKRYLETMPSDPGFVAMFNGKDLTGWKGFVTDPIKKAALTEKQLAKLQAKADVKAKENWSAVDGMIVFTGDGDNLVSARDYTDFEMVVNWRILKKGDSGIYLRGSPQVQIWDTSRVEVGAQVGSGGLYNNQVNESKPLKVADNPIGEWNTFHIIMKGERVTVYFNGILTVDNTILENYWDRSIPIFPKGAIELQAHGNTTYFKDIYVREIQH